MASNLSLSLIPLSSCSIYQIPSPNSALWSKRSVTHMLVCIWSFSTTLTSWTKQSHWCCNPCNSSTASLIYSIMALTTTAGTGPPRVEGWGDWPGSRKGTGTKTGSFLNWARNLFFLSLSLLLVGLLYYNPIEPNFNFDYIGPFYGAYVIWLRYGWEWFPLIRNPSQLLLGVTNNKLMKNFYEHLQLFTTFDLVLVSV